MNWGNMPPGILSMDIVYHYNEMAVTAAANLGLIYNRLAKSTERLSSGLRINSAADDPAGLAVRELMRSDIAALYQGIRNASDAVSLVQVADSAMAVIDEKLIRMKELAEQAATGTYTTSQRAIMNSEYQAMADEIDRIAEATDFNSTKLLDGSLLTLNNNSGLKVHFGPSNDPDEDYYFIRIDDVRATVTTGLKVGGDAAVDIWGQGGLTGCCVDGSFDSLTASIEEVSGKTFAYAYNYDQNPALDPNGTGDGGLASHVSYLGGIYRFSSGNSLQDLIDTVNQGSQSRIKVDFTGDVCASTWSLGSGAVNISLGDEVYQFIEGGVASAYNSAKDLFKVLDTDVLAGSALVQAINQSSLNFWAVKDGGDVYVFHRDGGNNDGLIGCDEGLGVSGQAAASAYVNWQDMETYQSYAASANFGNGGNSWVTLQALQTDTYAWSVKAIGGDAGDGYDLVLADVGSGLTNSINIEGMGFDTGVETLTKLSIDAFSELQNASDAEWAGGEIRTQSSAQEALDAITAAILKKDKTRADLGALHSRLENTVTNLTFQVDSLQNAESRISDVDIAREITSYTRDLVMAKAATAILAQANSINDIVLKLID